MQYRLLPFLILCLFAGTAECGAQISVPGLTPGSSTRADVERVLGQPVRAVSATLSEYKAASGPNKIYVQFSPSGDRAERIEILLSGKIDRGQAAAELGLPPAASSSKINSRSRLEEYFGGNNIVLTHDGTEESTPVSRIAYFSPKLFAAAAGIKGEDGSVKQPAIEAERVLPPAPPLGPRKDTSQPQVVFETEDGLGGMTLTEEDKKNLIKALNLPPDAHFTSTGREGEFLIPQEGGE